MTPDSPAPSPVTTWCAVVAHFDEAGHVADHLLRHVQFLHGEGLRVCFVSTGLSDAELPRLAPYAQVIRRDNLGYDFGSYRVGIDALGLLAPDGAARGCQGLLLLNSSMVVADPSLLFTRLQAGTGQADLLGLTQSHEVRPHLQSFWLAFTNAAILGSNAFRQWWREMPMLSDREAVIARLELGLSAHFVRAGFRLGALHRATRADQLRAVLRAIDNGFLPFEFGTAGPVGIDPAWAERLNPTMYAWDSVLAQLGVLKLELLKRNPHGIGLHALRQRLRQEPALRALVLDAAGCTAVEQLGT